MSRGLALVAFVTLVCVSRAPAQQILVVGPQPGPGVDFTSIDAAVSAAADGDVILVQPGSYVLDGDGVNIPNRRLVLTGLTGPGGARPGLIGTLAITGLDADHSVIVRGLDFQTNLLGSLPALSVTTCAGPVLFEDCSFSVTDGYLTASPTVSGSGHVVFTRCTFIGPAKNGASRAGLEVMSSDVALYDCHVTGGWGMTGVIAFGLAFPGTPGAPGLRLTTGSVLLAGGEVDGGPGGAGFTDPGGQGCAGPGNGGTGLVVSGLVRELDVSVTGGVPGAMDGCGPAGSIGPTQLVTSGSVVTVPELLRHLTLSSPAISGGVCTVAIHGQPGELVALAQASAPLGTWLKGLKGTLAGAAPYTVFILGPLPPDGSLTLPVTLAVPLLPPGVNAVSLVDQLVVAASSGGGLLSTPATVLLLEEQP